MSQSRLQSVVHESLFTAHLSLLFHHHSLVPRPWPPVPMNSTLLFQPGVLHFWAMGLLTIKNLVFYGYHGVQDFEKELGGRFEVDIGIKYPFKRAANEDDLDRAIDYQQVYSVVESMITGKKYHLIETLADHIAEALVEKFDVDEVTVVLRKNKVPINAVLDFIEVEVTRPGTQQ